MAATCAPQSTLFKNGSLLSFVYHQRDPGPTQTSHGESRASREEAARDNGQGAERVDRDAFPDTPGVRQLMTACDAQAK